MDETSSANQWPPVIEPPLYIREGPTRRGPVLGRPSTNEAGNEQVKSDSVLGGSPARFVTSSSNQSPPAFYKLKGPIPRPSLHRMAYTNEAENELVKSDSVLGGSPASSANTTPRDSCTLKVLDTTTSSTTFETVEQECINDDERFDRQTIPPPTKESTSSRNRRRPLARLVEPVQLKQPDVRNNESATDNVPPNCSHCHNCFAMHNRHAERPARQSVPPEQSDVRTKERATDNVPPNSSSNMAFKVLAVAALVLIAAVALGSSNSSSHVPKKEPFHCNRFQRLHSKYPQLDDMLWSTLIVGVERAINKNPGEPATFIFLQNSSSVVESLLQDVIDITLECFGSGSAIWRSSADFQSPEIATDHGDHLELYRHELQSKGVLVVRNLDQVPPNAAQIFFTICDSYEPLVRKAVIFFTIDISQQPEHVVRPELSATSIAERILKDLWKRELDPNELDPLVVRLTENVFTIE